MKKTIVLVITLILALCLGLVAFADGAATPRWTYIGVIAGDISGSNPATAGATVSLYDSNKYADISVTLQKYSGGWVDQDTWDGSGYGSATASGSPTLSRGSYRLKISVTVRVSAGGTALESTTVYTDEKSIR